MSDYNSSLPVRTENAGDISSRIVDNVNPANGLSVDNNGKIHAKLSDGAGNEVTSQTNGAQRALDVGINVGGVQIDPREIRDLTAATDSVEARQADHDNLNVNANIQVGNVDVSGANPVPVSATDLDIRDLSAAQDNVAISDGVDTLAINADGSINSVVSATDLDIRDLTHVSDSVKIGDGTDFLAVNTDGSINVVVQEDVGTEVVNFNIDDVVAGGASSNHDYLVTNGGKLFQVLATGSGKMKAEVQIETGSATNVFSTVAVGFNSTATPNIELMLAKYALIPVGARVRVIRSNRENQAQDLYSTIILISN